MGDVITMDGGQLPAHLRGLAEGSLNTDLSGGVSTGYPHVSFKGKAWRVVQGEDSTLLTMDDGETPRPYIEAVILKANPNLSKIYYSKGYEEGSNAKPDCYSNDSVSPAADAVSPQAAKCAACPHNAWGSRVSEHGAKGKACSDSRRLAIAPADDLEHPMLLRIPAATLKELTNYAELLNRRRAPYTAVVTRIGFDHQVAHPKLTFKAIRWVSEEEAKLVTEVLEREVIGNITGTTAWVSRRSEEAVESLPPPPAYIAEEPEELPGAPPRYAASEDEVAAVVDATVEPPKAKPIVDSKVSAVLSSADQSLDAALRMLDEEDD